MITQFPVFVKFRQTYVSRQFIMLTWKRSTPIWKYSPTTPSNLIKIVSLRPTSSHYKSILLIIVCTKIQFFNLRNQWITWICPRTLVIKSTL